jgi:Fe-S cluster assembly protein SufD
MLVTQDVKDKYTEEFAPLAEQAAANGAKWLLPTREAAMARFAELGFPTIADEAWRFTNVAPIASTPFDLPDADDPAAAGVTRERIAPLLFGDALVHLAVFVNGRFAPALSSLGSLPKGVVVESLARAAETKRSLVEPYLTRYASYENQPFVAMNTAFLDDGAFVHVPKNVVVEGPIHLLFVSAGGGLSLRSHPRNLIVGDVSSRVAVVESYAGLDASVYLTNAVTEIVALDNAAIDHYKVCREADSAYHVGATRLQQHRDSDVASHTISTGGAIARHDVHVVLDGEGCECALNGLYVVGGAQHVDNHLRVEHAKPHCNSREFYKGILRDQARGVFTGRIYVHKDAQKTDGKQTNMNLLLSEDAHVDTRPQLEIFADDVKCTHGATIGQLDQDAIFYLRARGISEAEARGILVYAFARECIDRVRIEPLRAQLDTLLRDQLPHGDLLGVE